MNLKMMALMAAAAAAVLARGASSPERADGPNPLNAVVKIETVGAKPNLFEPWQTGERFSCSGSGVVIAGRRILTNAHCVLGGTLVTVSKQTDDDPFPARVEFLDYGSDLAILKVTDEGFFDDIVPMELGASPIVREHVVVIGYPGGSDRVAFTEGIVSRVELQRYSLSQEYLLAAQIDAAINPGNSGGPVLDTASMKVAGIAFQVDEKGQNVGYIIPVDVVRHFLTDCEDGHVDETGVPGFGCFELTNPDARRYHRMGPNMTGTLVRDVDYGWLGTNSVRNGDVLLAVDGIPVSDKGTIRMDGDRTLGFSARLQGKQVGEPVVYELLRDGRRVTVTNQVGRIPTRVRPWLVGRNPDYYIFGGLVFSTLTMDLWMKLPPGSDFKDLAFAARQDPDDEIVMLVDVLAHPVNLSYDGGWPVSLVDGKPVRNLRDLVKRLDATTNAFTTVQILVADKHFDLALDTAKCRAAMPEILARYHVPGERAAGERAADTPPTLKR